MSLTANTLASRPLLAALKAVGAKKPAPTQTIIVRQKRTYST